MHLKTVCEMVAILSRPQIFNGESVSMSWCRHDMQILEQDDWIGSDFSPENDYIPGSPFTNMVKF